MKAWLPPTGWERRYGRFLRRTVAEVKREFLARLGHIIRLQTVSTIANGPAFENETFTADPTAQNSEEIELLIIGLIAWWQLQKPLVRGTIRGYFNAVNLFNDKQFIAVVKDITGLTISPAQAAPFIPNRLVSPLSVLLEKFGDKADVYRQEPYLDGIETNWVSTQETYIDKTVTQAISDSEIIVRNGLVTSAIAKVIHAAIEGKFNAVLNRVNAVASDQIDKLDIQLSANRQRSLGAKQYIWETRRDERVRGNPAGLYPNAKPSHYHRQGVIFNWDRPPEGGHPGEAPGCRCRAVMRLPR